MENIITMIQEHTVLGVVIAAVGGIVVKWVDRTLRQNTNHFSEASKIRQELRDEITMLQSKVKSYEEEIDELENSSDKWRQKYYALVERILVEKNKYRKIDQS